MPDSVTAHRFSALLLGNPIEKKEGVQVLITNSDPVNVSVELFSTSGIRLAATYTQGGIVTLPSSSLGAGMYYIRCIKNDDTILLKLLIK